MGKILEEFIRFAAEPSSSTSADLAGYYEALAAEGLSGETIGDDVEEFVRINVAATRERIEQGRGLEQSIGDAVFAVFLFAYRLGRRRIV